MLKFEKIKTRQFSNDDFFWKLDIEQEIDGTPQKFIVLLKHDAGVINKYRRQYEFKEEFKFNLQPCAIIKSHIVKKLFEINSIGQVIPQSFEGYNMKLAENTNSVWLTKDDSQIQLIIDDETFKLLFN